MYRVHNCWHFNIYLHDNTSDSSDTRQIIMFQHFSFYKELKIHAQLS